MATKSDYKIYKGESNFHLVFVNISQFRSSILVAAYMSNIYTNIGRISPRLEGSRDGCMFVCEFDVFHNVIHSKQVKHSAKHRGIDQQLFGLCKLRTSK